MLDLWPQEIVLEQVKPPVTILQEQAILLGEKTRNLVKAEVDVDANSMSSIYGDSADFLYAFYLTAPKLGDYHYRLFSIEYPMVFYPVQFYIGSQIYSEQFQIYDDDIKPERNLVVAESEAEFIDYLGKILQSERTKQIISALMVQSEAFEDYQVPF